MTDEQRERLREIRVIVNGPNYYHEGRFYKSRYDNYLLGDALLLLQECVAFLDTQSQSSLSQLMTDEDKCIAREQAALEAGEKGMREACVEKLRERLHDPSLRFSDDGIKAAVTDWTNMLVGILESLTLDQMEQEKQ